MAEYEVAGSLAKVQSFFGVASLGVDVRMPIEIPDADRADLAKLGRVLGARRVVEVGVEQGEYAEALCRANPEAHVYGVDPWKAMRGYRDHVSQEKLDGFYEATLRRMAAYAWTPMRGLSVEVAASAFAPRSLDFVYIDANHNLPNVIADLAAWVPKVKDGGIIAGHDYCRRKRNGYQVHVVEAVGAWTSAYHVRPWFIVGRKDRIPGEKRDDSRSWFWVVDHEAHR